MCQSQQTLKQESKMKTQKEQKHNEIQKNETLKHKYNNKLNKLRITK